MDADLAAVKNTRVNDRLSLQVRGEFFNAFNNINFGTPNNILAGSGFGRITGMAGASSANTYGTAQPRVIQLGLKAAF